MEILVALAVTLLMMLAAVTLFSTIGRGMNKNVRDADLFQRMRNAHNLLDRDLANRTENAGYFEIIEHFGRDEDGTGANSHKSDPDDILAFTARYQDEPFLGVAGQTQIVIPGSGDIGGSSGTATSGSTTTGTSTTTTTTTTTTGGSTTGSPDPLCVLDQDYGFYQSGSYTYSSNPNTKWIRATNNLSSANGSWYVITTDGNLRIWVSGTTYGSPISNVGTAVYTNPALLHNAYTGSPCPNTTTTTGSGSTGTTTAGGTTAGSTTGTTTGSTTTTTVTPGTPTQTISMSVQTRSPAAEVIWFVHNGALYRRVLPITPGGTIPDMAKSQFYSNYTVSAREEGTNRWQTNSLSDLENRRNRHAHDPTAPPYLFSKTELVNNLNSGGGDQLGAIAVLDNVVGFDVRVWDPGAPILSVASVGGGTTGGGTTTGTTTTGTTTTGTTTTGTTTTGGTTAGTTTGGGTTTTGTTTTSTTSTTTTTTTTTTGGTTTGGTDPLCILDRDYGFFQSGAYTYSSNPNTKWIRATNNLSGANSSWYVITTDGNLRIWVSGTTYGSPIANVGTAVYTNPALLHNAFDNAPGGVCP